MNTLRWVMAALLVLTSARTLRCQSGLAAAGGTTSLLARDFSSLTVETKESSLSLLLESGVSGMPTTWKSNFRVSLSANESKRDLFSEGRWVPGLAVEERLARVWNRADLTGDREGYVAAYLSAGYEMKDNALARVGPGSAIETYDRTSQTLSLGLGLNFAPRETGPILGTSASVGWRANTPVQRRTSEVCTEQASGTDGGGTPVRVLRCQNRYVGEVHDTRTGEFRVDLRSPHLVLPVGRRSRERASELLSNLDSILELSPTSANYDSRLAAIEARELAASDAIAQRVADVAARAAEVRAARERAQAGGLADQQALAIAETRLQVAEVRERELRAAHRAAGGLRKQLEESVQVVSDVPMVSLLASGAVEVAEGDHPIYNLAVGPMLHPAFTPLKVVAGLLFELDDLTNAAGGTGNLADRFSVRLHIGVPF